MKKKILKILKITLWVVLFAGAGVLLGFANYEQDGTLCRNVYINMDYGQSDMLITREDVDSILRETNGFVKGKPLYRINTEKIESPVRKQPYVEDARVYLSDDGNLFIDVVQRQPVLRIITRNFQSFYIDGKGEILPLKPNYPARVLVATGAISDSIFKDRPKTFDSLMADSSCNPVNLSSLFRLAIFIANDPFFKSQIEQIYVMDDGEIELIPRVGKHVILLGCANDLQDKFHKLYVFYKLGLNQIGWNKYNVINIKFKNQVVCSKI